MNERVPGMPPSAAAEPGVVVPSAFVAFFDDAAVFPPGLAELDVAVANHLARRDTPFGAAIGPLVLPLSAAREAGEIASRLNPGSRPVEVSLIVPAGRLTDALAVIEADSAQLDIVAIELKTSGADHSWRNDVLLAADRAHDVQLFVELSAAQIREEGLEFLAASDAKLKFRTGGIEAHLFPSAEDLAAVLRSTVEAQVAFKLTAGLHRAVRYDAPATGFAHHGFLNIAVATLLALAGTDPADLVGALRETDGARLAESYRALAGAHRWRTAFLSFGTCDAIEPAGTLAALGLFPSSLIAPTDEGMNL